MHRLKGKTLTSSTAGAGRRATRVAVAAAAVSALALGAAACGGGGDDGGKKDSSPSASGSASAEGQGGEDLKLPDLHGQKLEVAAVWTGPEQKNFQKVLDEFDKRTGAKSTFVPTGDSQSTFLGAKIEGGAPPDVAFLAQNGVLHQFVDKGWVKPLGPGRRRNCRRTSPRAGRIWAPGRASSTASTPRPRTSR
jgi:multiple sugar transport system substrate-binding protein/alpha-glucoside transport system substrate-binding protein